jgi:predicted dehydrogenase
MTRIMMGLIGCGDIAQQVHLHNLTRLNNVELAAFADPDDSRRSMTAQLAPGARAFHDYRQLLDNAVVDAVLVCVPNSLHAEATIAALRNGVHVYLEKPLATKLDDACAVLETWRAAQVVGMMGFNYRLNKLYRAVRKQIASGAFGKLLTVRTVFSTDGRHLPAWKLTRQTGGGALFDLASHHLDLIRYLFEQEVAEVFAVIQSRRSEHDTAWLQMRLADGLTIQSFFSTAGGEEDSFEVYGEDQKLTVDRYRSLGVHLSPNSLKGLRVNQMKQSLRSLTNAPYAVSKIRAAAQEPSYRAALQSFVEAVRSKGNRAPDFYDGYYNLAIIDAAERSAKTGSIIKVDVAQARAMCA